MKIFTANKAKISIYHYGAAALSGLLLALPYSFSQLFLLSWIAFIPLILATQHCNFGQLYRLGLVFGLVFYPTAAYWIPDFIVLFKGYPPLKTWIIATIFWLYCSHQPVVLLIGYRLLQRWTSLHPYLLFPSVATLVYSFYPMVFSIQLGESQSYFLSAMQAIEFTGIYGLDFLISLVNIMLAYSIAQRNQPVVANALASCVVVIWFGYGIYASLWWDREVTEWQTTPIGFVQPNESPSVDIPPPAPGFSRGYPPEMAYSEILAEQGAALIVWPETRYKGYYRYSQVRQAFNRKVKQLNTPLIFQDNERTSDDGKQFYYNAATLLGSNGEKLDTYRKTERVAFGEYLPVFDESPIAKRWVKKYLGNFFIDFSAGNQPSEFKLSNLTLAPLICYEVLIPGYVAKAIGPHPQGKLLTVISNNGWFGETLQPYGHLHGSIMRTVEHRLPMLHVVNNGPSALVMPNGRIILQTPYHEAGGVLAEVPYNSDSGGSLFSQYPNGFIYGLYALLLGGALLHSPIGRLVSRKKY